MNGKSIKEVSAEFDVSIQTLRYWDSKGLFPRLQRNQSGYREYQPDDIRDLQTILCLRRIGIELDEMATIMMPLNDDDSDQLRQKDAVLAKHEAELKDQKLQIDLALMMIDIKKAIYHNPDHLSHEQIFAHAVHNFVVAHETEDFQNHAGELINDMLAQPANTALQAAGRNLLMQHGLPESQEALTTILDYAAPLKE